MYGLTVITPPSVEPVPLAIAKRHLKVDHDDEDDLITGWIRAARELTELHTGRRWVTQSLRLTLGGWPGGCIAGIAGAIDLMAEPVASVELVKYADQAGAVQTFAADGFQTWLDHSPPIVCPAPNGVWPALQSGKVAPVTIEFTAGAPVEQVPEAVKTAILLTLGYWDANRGDGTEGSSDPRALGLSPGAVRLLNLHWTGAYR